MTAAYTASGPRSRWADRAYWLPPGGIDNGLDARTWTVLLDVDASDMAPVLAGLRQAGIAAYAAPVGRLRPGRRPSAPTFRIWVDTWPHARAEDVVRRILPAAHLAAP
ncbi:MAG: hypothetical protein ACRDNF_06165 [Streptosporangiaceae bacterium]